MLRDYDYPTYGPVGICYLLQHEYGDCVIEKMRNDIPPSLNYDPERNLAGNSGQQCNDHGLCCH